jgi:hypothetical protein
MTEPVLAREEDPGWRQLVHRCAAARAAIEFTPIESPSDNNETLGDDEHDDGDEDEDEEEGILFGL